MNNIFMDFQEFIKNMERQLTGCEDKGLVLESNLKGLIHYFNEMKFQIQSDFKTIKDKPRDKIRSLNACQKIIEFVLMNNNIDNELVETFFGIETDESGNLKIKLLT